MIEEMVREHLHGEMVINMSEIGKMEKKRAWGYIFSKVVPDTPENGRKGRETDRALSLGSVVRSM